MMLKKTTERKGGVRAKEEGLHGAISLRNWALLTVHVLLALLNAHLVVVHHRSVHALSHHAAALAVHLAAISHQAIHLPVAITHHGAAGPANVLSHRKGLDRHNSDQHCHYARDCEFAISQFEYSPPLLHDRIGGGADLYVE